MSCQPKCAFTATLDHNTGKRLMISQGGKFDKELLHPMCDDCLKEMMAEAERALDPDAKFKSMCEWVQDEQYKALKRTLKKS